MTVMSIIHRTANSARKHFSLFEVKGSLKRVLISSFGASVPLLEASAAVRVNFPRGAQRSQSGIHWPSSGRKPADPSG